MRKILVVEDEPILRESYETIISTQPYQCDVASNGREALEKCKKKSYDLIFLDIMMPEINGVEFLEKYPDLERMKSKIIILSNLSSGKELERVQELGVLKNLVKSNVSPKQLITTIRYELEKGNESGGIE